MKTITTLLALPLALLALLPAPDAAACDCFPRYDKVKDADAVLVGFAVSEVEARDGWMAQDFMVTHVIHGQAGPSVTIRSKDNCVLFARRLDPVLLVVKDGYAYQCGGSLYLGSQFGEVQRVLGALGDLVAAKPALWEALQATRTTFGLAPGQRPEAAGWRTKTSVSMGDYHVLELERGEERGSLLAHGEPGDVRVLHAARR